MSTGTDYLARLRNGETLTIPELSVMILRLSIPAILAQISSVVMQYIDASMVGSLGASGSAAIGLVASTTWLFGGLCGSIGIGFTVQCAQRIGAGDGKDARNLMMQGLLVVAAMTLLVSLLGVSIHRGLPAWLGGGPDIVSNASAYFLIFALFYPIDQINNLCGGFLQASGNMRTPGMLHVLMCFLDVIFNCFLIFPGFTFLGIRFPGLGMGVAGAALGTGLAKLVSCLMMSFALLRRSPLLHLVKDERVHFVRPQILKAFRISVPVAVENFVMSGASVITTRIIAPLGTVSVAANSLSITAESLCYMPGFGIASAAQAVIGQSIGAGRRDYTKKLAWITTSLGMLVMTAIAFLMYAGAPYMIGFLSPDPEVVALGTTVLRIEAFAEPMFAASIVANGVLRGGGDTLVPAVLGLISMWAVRVPLAAFLSPRIGLRGAWLAMCIELCVRGVLFLLRMKQGKYIDRE